MLDTILQNWPELYPVVDEDLKPRYYDASRPRDTLHLDYETRSDADITNVGLDVYTLPKNNPSVLMAAYRINGGRLNHWEAHRGPIPAELKEALLDPSVLKWAFNSSFERTVTRRLLGINTPIEGWRCSMVLAYMHSFTGKLAEVGVQVGLAEEMQKTKGGKRFIDMFCKPQRITKNQPHEWRDWRTDPQEWEEFCQYNVQDVVTEEALKERLIRYPVLDSEWEFYRLDQEINDRGMPLDWDFVQNVIWMSDRRKSELLNEMQEITGVDNPNSRDQILPWLQANGFPYSDLQKETVEKALNQADSLDPVVIEVLRRRQWASKTSITKAQAARRSAGPGSRVRFMYQFAGASRTGRFSGRLTQPQNLPRTPKAFDPEDDEGERLTHATDLIREGNYDGFSFLDEPMLAFTGCMRGMFRASPDEQLVVSDYASVESAGLAWVSKCDSLLDVFRNGLDPYKYFGTLLYHKPYDQITRAERQICKPGMLASGYRMGAGELKDGVKTGLLKYAGDMGVEMTPDEAKQSVKTFREGFPEIPQLWYACERAVRHVLATGQPYKLDYFSFEFSRPYLLLKLPSGRVIYYYKPRIEKRIVDTGRTKSRRSRGWDIDNAPPGQMIEVPDTYERQVFTYMGRNQKTTKWQRVEGHGGVLVENLTQALTRDILKIGMMRLHKAGFNLVGHAHDEAIALQKQGDNYYTLELMKALMKAPIEWAPGFPLGAAGYTANFYRK